MRYRILLVLGVAVLMLSGCAQLRGIRGTAVPSPAPLPTLDAYLAQRVSWTPCPDQRDAECGAIRVPVDYSHPEALALSMPLVRLRATDRQARIGVLTTNPGGPGESGYEQVLAALDPNDTVLGRFRARYDLVGFDPRGVGRTAGISCLDDKEMDAYLATDFTPADAAGMRKVADAHKRYATACLRNAGKLLGFVGTEFVAKDMEIMRSALGEQKLNYFGFSYGTRLGQEYADQYPHRVGRMLLDSVDDPSEETARWDLDHDSAPSGMSLRDQLVHTIFEKCAARTDCPVGNDADAAMRKLRELIDRVDVTPIPVADGRRLGSNLATLGAFQATYGERYWRDFEQALADAFDGDGTGLAELADTYVGRRSGRYTSSDPAFWAVQCANDDPAKYRSKSEDEILAFLARKAQRAKIYSPLFGENRTYSSPLCLFWPVPPSEKSHAARATGAPTIVLLNNTNDPATPLDEAQSVARHLADAVLVINEHDGHIAYDSGSSCIDTIATDFLLDGAIPPRGTRCHR
ncbi:alpha/beta hydrolase [Nocardia sp. NPDC052566]|uniref:alpha/beta hydrolase n=1 Tax=Nocardia sp. NPDC052566 TaxID=3364330 RepID=UPI0037C55695